MACLLGRMNLPAESQWLKGDQTSLAEGFLEAYNQNLTQTLSLVQKPKIQIVAWGMGGRLSSGLFRC